MRKSKRKQVVTFPASRLGGRRACLCPDTETYSVKCCDGSNWSQCIGNITGSAIIIGDWILLTGQWNDDGVWKDDSTWIDSI